MKSSEEVTQIIENSSLAEICLDDETKNEYTVMDVNAMSISSITQSTAAKGLMIVNP